MKRINTGLIAALVGLTLSAPVFAQQDGHQQDEHPQEATDQAAWQYKQKGRDLDVRAKLEQRIAQLKDEAAKETLIEEVRHRVRLCKACHGEDGNSVMAKVPSLAGQNPVYLVDQFQRFGDGRRYDFTMSSLAKTIKNDDKIKLAIYFAEQKMKPAGGGKPELREQGKQLFQTRCAGCHGADAKGHEGYARLAGQKPDYIKKILSEFKSGIGRRQNPWMSEQAKSLSDVDIEAVASYLANLE